MSAKKRYAEFDNTFTYNPDENYTLEDFSNLSVTKVQSIARELNIRNVKRYKKEELIPVVLHKHKETQNPCNSVEEETVAKEKDGSMESKLFSITPNTPLELSEQLKLKFHKIVHCKFNNDNSKWDPIDINTTNKIPSYPTSLNIFIASGRHDLTVFLPGLCLGVGPARNILISLQFITIFSFA